MHGANQNWKFIRDKRQVVLLEPHIVPMQLPAPEPYESCAAGCMPATNDSPTCSAVSAGQRCSRISRQLLTCPAMLVCSWPCAEVQLRQQATANLPCCALICSWRCARVQQMRGARWWARGCGGQPVQPRRPHRRRHCSHGNACASCGRLSPGPAGVVR